MIARPTASRPGPGGKPTDDSAKRNAGICRRHVDGGSDVHVIGTPPPESIAFQAANARLKYEDTHIEYDARGCYQSLAPDGHSAPSPSMKTP